VRRFVTIAFLLPYSASLGCKNESTIAHVVEVRAPYEANVRQKAVVSVDARSTELDPATDYMCGRKVPATIVIEKAVSNEGCTAEIGTGIIMVDERVAVSSELPDGIIALAGEMSVLVSASAPGSCSVTVDYRVETTDDERTEHETVVIRFE
jgi:hypothetical protein